jgi:DNA-binding transcriptional LysR family regulator
MDFRLLNTFDVVSSMMSFNGAAKVLHCTQSTVSAQIRSLEDDLGMPLFERLGRCIALTPAGEELRRHVRRLLDYEHGIRASLKDVGVTAGLISLRVPQSVADLHLPTLFRRFCSKYPRVGFDVSDCGFSQLPNELRTGEIDAGFLYSMTMDWGDLCSTVVLDEPLAYVASPTSCLAARADLGIHDLAGQTLLVAKHDCAYRMKLQQELTEEHVETAAVIELNSVHATVNCLRTGTGVALLPERAVTHELATGELVKLRWRDSPMASLYFIRHVDKPRVGAYGAFVSEVELYFSALRAQQSREVQLDGNSQSENGDSMSAKTDSSINPNGIVPDDLEANAEGHGAS